MKRILIAAMVLVLTAGCSVNSTFVYKPGAPAAGGPKLPQKVAVLPFRDGTEDFTKTGSILALGTVYNLVKGGMPSTISPLPPELWSKLFADELTASGTFRVVRFVYTRSEFPEADLWIDGMVRKAYWPNSLEAPNRFALSFVARRGGDNEVVWEREVARESNMPADLNKGCGMGIQCMVDRIHAELNRQMQALFAEARADLVATLASLSGNRAGEGGLPPAASSGEAREEEFVGIGLRVSIAADVLTVDSAMEGTPASKAGMQAGDAILSVDGKPTAGMAVADAVGRMRGVKGTSVTLGIMRAGWNAPRNFTIVRDVIRVGTPAPPAPESTEQTIERILKGK
jgi:hypothetical protein